MAARFGQPVARLFNVDQDEVPAALAGLLMARGSNMRSCDPGAMHCTVV